MSGFEILENEQIRNWIWWIIIPLSIIFGLVIVYCVGKFFDRNNDRDECKCVNRDDKSQ